MAKIFVSYRVEDTGDTSPIVAQWLAAEYGPSAVIRDVSPSLVGEAYRAELDAWFRHGVVVALLVGPAFVSAATATGVPLLSLPDDRVRIELETALGRSQPIVPLLLDDTPPLTPDGLPDALRALATVAALPLHSRAPLFESEMRQVYASLARWMNPPQHTPYYVETPIRPAAPATPPVVSAPAQPGAFDQTQPVTTSGGSWGTPTPPLASQPAGAVSRRAALGGFLGLGALLAGAGVLWLARGHSVAGGPSSATTTATSSRLATATSTANAGTSTASAGTPTGQVGTRLATYARHTNAVDALAWSPDGRWIASGAWDNTVQLWDAATGTQRLLFSGHSDHVISVAWSPDGRLLASASDDGTAKIWDAQTGAVITTYTGHGGSSVWSVAWSPDGSLIASGGRDNTAQVWNPKTGQQLHLLSGHSDAVRSVCWSPDGSRLATASYDHTARVWDVASETALGSYAGHTDKVWVVGWSADGRSVATGGDTTVHVWNPTTFAPNVIYRQHTGGTWWLAWSPRSRAIASCSADTTVRLWNADTGTTSYVYRGHSASVNFVAWSHDALRVASGSDDRTVQVWRPG
ncbi:MAG TPA: WD40 repeat domain-containing protein [Ktedonobacterales bacterium]|nr:WD40 repeat domain-containing protein [Ktedonobacterales bacterium]